MNPTLMDATLALLKPSEVPGALRLLALPEEPGHESAEEAAEWRRRMEFLVGTRVTRMKRTSSRRG